MKPNVLRKMLGFAALSPTYGLYLKAIRTANSIALEDVNDERLWGYLSSDAIRRLRKLKEWAEE